MFLDKTVRQVRSLANDIDVDDLLDTLGLQRSRSSASYVLPAVGILGAGILLGAGLGLLFAPTSGKALRREAEGKVNDIKEKIRSTNVIGAGSNGVNEFAGDVQSSFERNVSAV